MKIYNLNNTPIGNLRVEFLTKKEFSALSQLDFLKNIMKIKDNYLYKGSVNDCPVYPKVIKKLANNYSHVIIKK